MGCDIHLFAEAKVKRTLASKLKFWEKPEWKSIQDWEYDPEYESIEVTKNSKFYTGGRNYNLFCALCGVRKSMFSGNPKSISKPRGIPTDTCKEIKEYAKRWDGDGHSHNYNTLKELKSFDWSDYGNTCTDFRNEVISKMEAIGVKDEDVRIVYFFDN